MPLTTTAAGTLRPQYAFRQRRDRQRIALRVAAGMDPAVIAGIERAAPETIRQLLGEPSFAKLILHYEELAALDPAGRRARILAMAVEVIRLAVLASNVAVANLVVHEELMGRRDPAETIAEAVEKALRKAHLARGPLPQPRQPRAGPANFRSPEPLAATEPDAEAAARLAVAERAKVEHRLARISETLVRRVLAEAERGGTWRPRGQDALLAAMGRWLHRQKSQAFDATLELQRRRERFKAGLPADYDPAPLSGPVLEPVPLKTPSPRPSPAMRARGHDPRAAAPPAPSPVAERWERDGVRVLSTAPPPSPPRPPPDPETRRHILREIKDADELDRPMWEAALSKLDSG